MTIPLAVPDISDLEIAYASEAVASTWVSSNGKWISRAEKLIAAASHRSDAVVTTSGTTALHLALEALGVGPGDEVVVPALTYVATANAVSYTGATPVLCDVDPETWCLSVSEIEKVVSSRTRGVIFVDLYGRLGDIADVWNYCESRSIFLVEDAAEALGASNDDGAAGSFGTVSVFSYYGNKILTSGEGGAVLTDDAAIASRLRLLRGQGMDPVRRYFFPVIGFNYRMTNVAAAILCAQYERADNLLAERRRVYAAYLQGLGSVTSLQPQAPLLGEETAPWLFSALLTDQREDSRDDLALALERAGVETRPFFIPISELPPYRSASRFPNAELLSRIGLNLPTYPALSEDSVASICKSIRDWCQHRVSDHNG